MFIKKDSIRQIPGFISYMELFSSNKLAYSLFIGIPLSLSFLLAIINSIFKGSFDLFYFIRYSFFFLILSGFGTLFSMTFYARKSPLLRAPPKGWALQINIFLCAVMGMTFFFGNTIAIILNNLTFQEVFFILGTVISYIVA
ncbi:MAG: hypothetical protein ACFFFB_08415, partial [Candidatus Heimdallarchaeota archaeon]